MRFALFATCIGDSLFPQAPQATVTILERLGHEVVFPDKQVCCGQMHANTGYFAEAGSIIANHVRTFAPVLDGEWDAIVVPSGSCTGATRHEQSMVLEHIGEDTLAMQARQIAKHTYDLSELLVDVLGVTDVGAYFPHRVVYHPTCHSLRITKVGDRPYQLLRAVQGIDLVDLPDAEVCCGFGGTFAMKNHETSAAMLANKMTNVLSTQAEVLCTGDYSCLMHIGGGLSRLNSGVRMMHLAEILASTQDEPFVSNVSFAPDSLAAGA